MYHNTLVTIHKFKKTTNQIAIKFMFIGKSIHMRLVVVKTHDAHHVLLRAKLKQPYFICISQFSLINKHNNRQIAKIQNVTKHVDSHARPCCKMFTSTC